MKQLISTFLMSFIFITLSVAEETNFRGVKVADARGKQADATIFSDTSKKVIVRVADRDFIVVSYDQFDKLSYEYTKKHRITAGALVMVASLGAGAVVMLTSSKSHWLYMDYHEQNVPKVVVLRMDKKEYKDIMAAFTAHTGKEVSWCATSRRWCRPTRCPARPSSTTRSPQAARCRSPTSNLAQTTSPSCNIPAAPPASPRARCCCIAIWSPMCCRWWAWNAPMVAAPPVTDRIIVVTALPLYHIFALTACFLFAVHTGGMCILIPNPRDIAGLIKEVSRYKVNLFPAVNTLYNALLHHPDFGKLDLSMLKSAVAGGMAVQKSVADAWVKATGKPIVEGYGLWKLRRCSRSIAATSPNGRGRSASRCPRRTFRSATRRPRGAVRRRRRNLRTRAAGDARLLEPARRDRQGHDRGRLFPHRRCRRHVDRRPVRIIDRKKDMISCRASRLSRTRSKATWPSCRRARMRGGWRAGCQVRRGGEAVVVKKARTSLTRNCSSSVIQNSRLQSAEVSRVPQGVAEDQRRQDPAPRAQRRTAGHERSRVTQLPSPSMSSRSGVRPDRKNGSPRTPPSTTRSADDFSRPTKRRQRENFRMGGHRRGRVGAAHRARPVSAQHVPAVRAPCGRPIARAVTTRAFARG